MHMVKSLNNFTSEFRGVCGAGSLRVFNSKTARQILVYCHFNIQMLLFQADINSFICTFPSK